MRSRLLVLIAALVAVNQCRPQERQPTNSAQGTSSLSALESQVVGVWRWTVPKEYVPGVTNAFITMHLSADRSWSLVPAHSDNLRAESDTQAGRWFIHDRALVLRINETKIELMQKMATVYDIQSVTKSTLIVTNSPLVGKMIWTRIAQPDGAANRSQPVDSATNRTSAAGSGG